MAHVEHKHEPRHGTTRVIRGGKVEHIELCPPTCCEKDLPTLSASSNVAAEVQSLVDILHRRIKDVDAQATAHGEKLSATEGQILAKIEGVASRADSDLANAISGVQIAMIRAANDSARTNAALSARIAILESRGLWDLVKRCFR